MARRRKSRGQGVELFPFLAILACVIGVLTLMIAGLSLGDLEIDTSGSEFVALSRQIEEHEIEIDALVSSASTGGLQGARIVHARAELARREERNRKVEALEDQLARLADALDAALRDTEASKKGLRELQRELASLENQLRGRRSQKPPERRVALSGPRKGSSGGKLEPYFIECRKSEVVFYPDRSRSRQVVVPTSSVRSSADFRRVCTLVNGRSYRTVILLVREGGVASHDLLDVLLRLNKVRHGSLPVPGQLKLDFSQLKGAGR